MLTKKMEEALNSHIKEELYSAYLYMSMSAHSSRAGLKGFASWFMVQYHEEMLHAMRFYEYILKQGGKVRLLQIKEPLTDFKSPQDMFEKTISHERYMTANINWLMDLAQKEKDHASQIFLQWFVTEQVEEEESANDILARLKLAGKDPNALFRIDSELAARVVAVPTDFSKGVEAAMKGTAA